MRQNRGVILNIKGRTKINNVHVVGQFWSYLAGQGNKMRRFFSEHVYRYPFASIFACWAPYDTVIMMTVICQIFFIHYYRYYKRDFQSCFLNGHSVTHRPNCFLFSLPVPLLLSYELNEYRMQEALEYPVPGTGLHRTHQVPVMFRCTFAGDIIHHT